MPNGPRPRRKGIRRPARPELVLVPLVVLALAIGIGIGWARSDERARSVATSPDAPTTSAPPPPATKTTPDSSGASPPTATQPPTGPSRIIQWIRDFAPLGGGADGPADEAFLAMIEGRCADALQLSQRPSEGAIPEPARTLYEGAGAACLAAFHHQPALWPRAQAALGRVAGRTAALDCEQQTVYRLARDLVDLHRKDPTARLVKQVRGGHGTLPCPRILKLTPDHGPAEGGYPIQVEGEHLPRKVGIRWGLNHHLTAESTDGRHAVITAPPASVAGEMEVFVTPDGWPWQNAGSTTFAYDPPGPTTTSSTTTSTTVPPPPSS